MGNENPAELTFRPFRPEDQPGVRWLVLSGLGDHFGSIDETMNPDLDDIQGAYIEKGAHVVVVEHGGRLAATGTLAEEAPGVGRIVRMSVSRDLRGHGIGKRTVTYLLDQAKIRNYRTVLVETTEDWQDAIGLYRACGFQTDGFRDGDIHMSLKLT